MVARDRDRGDPAGHWSWPTARRRSAGPWPPGPRSSSPSRSASRGGACRPPLPKQQAQPNGAVVDDGRRLFRVHAGQCRKNPASLLTDPVPVTPTRPLRRRSPVRQYATSGDMASPSSSPILRSVRTGCASAITCQPRRRRADRRATSRRPRLVSGRQYVVRRRPGSDSSPLCARPGTHTLLGSEPSRRGNLLTSCRQIGPGRVPQAPGRPPARLSELQTSVVAVPRVGAPIPGGLTLGDGVPAEACAAHGADASADPAPSRSTGTPVRATASILTGNLY